MFGNVWQLSNGLPDKSQRETSGEVYRLGTRRRPSKNRQESELYTYSVQIG